MPPKRMTANPIKAPRYRPGKSLAEGPSSESELDSDEEEAPAAKAIPAPPKATTAAGITSNLNKVDLNERRKQAIAKEAQRIEEEKALKAKEEEGFVTESEPEEEESENEEEGSESEEESSEEEEAPRRVMMRPTFIKKDKRGQNPGAAAAKEKSEEELAAAEEARRKALADEIVEEQIRKDLAAKEAGKKNWDDDEDEGDDVDDTDDIDPEAEYAAWKLRELKRIKREREAIEQREKELEEVERRKNLTEEERKAEDDAHLAAQKEEKESKGKMTYMQKYYHKGAFFQDDLKAEGLDRRDIMGSRFADDVQNRDLLPQALQMRDMTKLGKKGATKYRDLKSEDTGRWGQFDDRGPKRGGQFGVDERFLPDNQREGGPGASGSNSVPVGERKKVVGAPEGPRAMREGGGGNQRREEPIDSYRPSNDMDERRSRPRSRSRSPPPPRRERSRTRSRERFHHREEGNRSGHRYHDDRNRRKRSTSRDRDRYESDKRRRIDSR
ncbi:hypothetical protein G7Y89_g11957 [Cudoniella acicularis]|uniref:Micro-fibrillar-associated protein 1 C-terminal domain-containing protein n=1 Tax=Cudoniella acicularis TaxID=354080 RepID=A0A8H4W050_9HELO|nr:hypothetical protein G7Y89_g11957 [Cudoniella acicularis]